MALAEKLKLLRRQAGISQEKLAEKIGVSRQAVTKWETGAGTPDVENLMAVSSLFGISIDELLFDKEEEKEEKDFLFESVTEYDIDGPKRYDIKLGGAGGFVLSGYDGEKLRVRLASNTIASIQNDFKIKIDDIKKRIDVDVKRRNGVTEAAAKEAVMIWVSLPRRYVNQIEVAVNTETVEIGSLECSVIELNGRIHNLLLNNVVGTVEVDCNLDMNIQCQSLDGAVEINQISATSRICVPEGTVFAARCRGIGTSISYEKNGKETAPFSVSNAGNRIGLNGMKSELVICTRENEFL